MGFFERALHSRRKPVSAGRCRRGQRVGSDLALESHGTAALVVGEVFFNAALRTELPSADRRRCKQRPAVGKPVNAPAAPRPNKSFAVTPLGRSIATDSLIQSSKVALTLAAFCYPDFEVRSEPL
jgi:hypothetical protein